MTALARYEVDFSATQIAIVKEVICPGISDAQLAMFSSVCKLKRLDPFSKQIYATLRNDRETNTKKLTIQTGIDGFRLIAERTGKYGGQQDFEWCGPDGKWVDVWLAKEPPAAARATVIRTDWAKPLRRVARWSAYFQDRSPMWQKMGVEQLAKCAEALALRGAFPEELSGLYTDDEMAQADNEAPRPVDVRATVVEPPKPTAAAQKQLPPDSEQPPDEGEWGPRHERVWNFYKNSSVVDQPLTSIPTDKLVAYIDRLEQTVKGPATSKTPETAANAARAKVDAVPYLAAARVELVERRKLEAEMAGADAETGELPAEETAPPADDFRGEAPAVA